MIAEIVGRVGQGQAGHGHGQDNASGILIVFTFAFLGAVAVIESKYGERWWLPPVLFVVGFVMVAWASQQ